MLALVPSFLRPSSALLQERQRELDRQQQLEEEEEGERQGRRGGGAARPHAGTRDDAPAGRPLKSLPEEKKAGPQLGRRLPGVCTLGHAGQGRRARQHTKVNLLPHASWLPRSQLDLHSCNRVFVGWLMRIPSLLLLPGQAVPPETAPTGGLRGWPTARH